LERRIEKWTKTTSFMNDAISNAFHFFLSFHRTLSINTDYIIVYQQWRR
jgi:hypothetical protein